MKNLKKLRIVLSFVLGLAFLFGLAVVDNLPIHAATKSTTTYVALGDSITTGYGLVNFNENDVKNKSSANNFVNKLSKKLGAKAVNLGVEGLDSTRFLDPIAKPTTTEQKAAVAQIKNASVITISIGGNNVMLPLLAVLNEKIGNGKNIFTANAQEIQEAAIGLIFDTAAKNKLQNDVIAGAATFNGDAKLKKTGDYANIISTIKKLNPKAQIIVQTIYNPYDLPFTAFFDTAIKSMNAKIFKDSANGKNYKVADVYSAFSKAKPGTELVNADTGKTFDPHPTAKGQEVIYTVVASAAQNNTLPYKVKANITKGILTTKVSEGELLLTITPTKGYNVPTSISLTVGKGARTALTLKNGKASVPIADVGADIVVTGVCSK
ncbi:MAG: GDSL-type esterase/lipase family protein [Ruminiclostridium sp.]